MTLRLFTRTDLERAARLALTKWLGQGGDPEAAIVGATEDVATTSDSFYTRDDVYEAALLAAQLAHRDRDMEQPDCDNIAAQATRAVTR